MQASLLAAADDSSCPPRPRSLPPLLAQPEDQGLLGLLRESRSQSRKNALKRPTLLPPFPTSSCPFRGLRESQALRTGERRMSAKARSPLPGLAQASRLGGRGAGGGEGALQRSAVSDFSVALNLPEVFLCGECCGRGWGGRSLVGKEHFYWRSRSLSQRQCLLRPQASESGSAEVGPPRERRSGISNPLPA